MIAGWLLVGSRVVLVLGLLLLGSVLLLSRRQGGTGG
jgi:hypothetical protein